ncbi:hypothetical protein M3Y99_00832100 [Aphelenchoides fujianensis]|nr:hypothetical protein M3Y99_00832100 [Aphelenchoides fujianensis]
MADECKHSAFFSTVNVVQYRGVDVESPKTALPFRPDTKFNLVLTNGRTSLDKYVMIAIESSVEGLKGEMWILDEKGGDFIPRWEAKFNTNYWFHPSLNYRAFCKVYTEECTFCKEEEKALASALEREAATHRKIIKSLENDLSEQRLQAENTQNALQSRIHQLENAEAAYAQKNSTLTFKNAQLASNVRKLELKLGERKKVTNVVVEQCSLLQSKVNDLKSALSDEQTTAALLQSEVDELKAALSNEQTRFSSLQQQHRIAAEELEKARKPSDAAIKMELKLAALRQENAASNAEKKQLNAKMIELTAALEQQKSAAEAAAAEKAAVASEARANHAVLLSKVAHLESNEAKTAADRQTEVVEQRAVLERELKALKSTFSDEQTRSSSLEQRLQSDVETLAAIIRVEAQKAIERESKLAAVCQEDANERSDSSVSSEWEPVDAQ